MDHIHNKDLHTELLVNDDQNSSLQQQTIEPVLTEKSGNLASQKTSSLLRKLINPFGYADITIE